jgi:predicted dehydrogenase
MKKLKVAVIGLGDMGLIHANAFMNNPHVKLVAVCDKDKKVLDRFVKGPWNWKGWWPKDLDYCCYSKPIYPIKEISTDFNEIARKEEIDAVSICLPDTFHSTVALSMLSHEKHILIEKPMAPTLSECEKIMVAARTSKARVLVGPKGYAIYIRCAPSGWFLQKKYAGRGVSLNMGVHAVDTVRYLLGNPNASTVYAKIDTVYGKYDVDDLGVILVEFVGGPVSIVETGQNHPYADGLEASTQLFGTEGYARVFPTEVHLRIEGRWGIFKPDINTCHISPIMYQEEIDHFVDCIINEKESIIDGSSAMENIMIIEAAYQSSHSGRAVRLEELSI